MNLEILTWLFVINSWILGLFILRAGYVAWRCSGGYEDISYLKRECKMVIIHLGVWLLVSVVLLAWIYWIIWGWAVISVF